VSIEGDQQRRWLRELARDLVRQGRTRWHWWNRGVPRWSRPASAAPPARLVRRERRSAGETAATLLGGVVSMGVLLGLNWWLLSRLGDRLSTAFVSGTQAQLARLSWREMTDAWHRYVERPLGGPFLTFGLLVVLAAAAITVVLGFERPWVTPPAAVRRSLSVHRRGALQQIALVAAGFAGLTLSMGAGLALRPAVDRAARRAGLSPDEIAGAYRWPWLIGMLAVGALVALALTGRLPWVRYRAAHLGDVVRRRAPLRRVDFLDRAVEAGVLVVEDGGHRFADPALAAELAGRPLATPEDRRARARARAERVRGGTLRQIVPFVRAVRAWQLADAVDDTDEAAGFAERWSARPGLRPVRRATARIALGKDRPASAPEPIPYSAKARAALDTAAAGARGTLTTGQVLSAVIRTDVHSDWEGIWPFDPMSGRLVDSIDGEIEATPDDWSGTPMTPMLSAALRWLQGFANEYDLRPVPVGALALAMVRGVSSGAARVVMTLNEIEHRELLDRVHDDLLRADGPGIRDY
jgi:hypothetical protein